MNIFRYINAEREVFYNLFSPCVMNSPKTLDIGAGDCSFKRYFSTSHIISIDANPHDASVIKWACPDMLPFDDNEFFAVHCSHMVEHLCPDELHFLLTEMDRVLKPFGYICISAPMLTENFYNDLTHIRPYHPGVFMNYLCSQDPTNRSKELLGNYKMLKLQYRYSCQLKKTGFTAIFEKCFESKLLL